MSDEHHDEPHNSPQDIYRKIDALLGRRVGFAPPSDDEELDDFPLLTEVVDQDGKVEPACDEDGSGWMRHKTPAPDTAESTGAGWFAPASLPDLGVVRPHYDLADSGDDEEGSSQVPTEASEPDGAEFANVEGAASDNWPDQGYMPHPGPGMYADGEEPSAQGRFERPVPGANEFAAVEAFTPTNLPDLGIIPPHYDLDLIEPLPRDPLEEGLSELIARQQAQLEAMIRRVVREELERHQRNLE